MTVNSTCAGAADTVFVRDGQTVIAEYAATSAAASPLRKYVNASYVDEPVLLIDRTAAGSVGAGTDERFYYHRNQQYSITALCDNAGVVVERYAYTAYGEPTILDGAGTTTRTTSFIGNPYLYTAQEYDAETGLYHFNARMYEGSKGRFLSHDPIMYPDGYNTYAGWFACSMRDPTGHALTICSYVGVPLLEIPVGIPTGWCGNIVVSIICYQLGGNGLVAVNCPTKESCPPTHACRHAVPVIYTRTDVLPIPFPTITFDGVKIHTELAICVTRVRGYVGMCIPTGWPPPPPPCERLQSYEDLNPFSGQN